MASSKLGLVGALVLAGMLVSCGGATSGGTEGVTATETFVAVGSNLGEDVEFIFDETPDGKHEVQATVLAEPGQEAMICTGDSTASIPPHCGDIRIANWDWDAVTDEEQVADVTWGTFHFVGTLDGDVFTVSGFLD
jgi:hypothetical protein